MKDVPDDSDLISNEYAEIVNYAVKAKAQNKTLKTIFENDDKDSNIDDFNNEIYNDYENTSVDDFSEDEHSSNIQDGNHNDID